MQTEFFVAGKKNQREEDDRRIRKYVSARQATDNKIKRRMRFKC